GPDVVTTMVGVWLAGGVYVPINPRDPDAAAVIADTDPAAVVRVDGVEHLDGGRPYDDGVAFVMWTSGTTGKPKPVQHTHAAYVELLDRVLGPLRGSGGKTPAPNLIPVSMALNAGLYNSLFGLRAGAALVIMDRFEPQRFAELVR